MSLEGSGRSDYAVKAPFLSTHGYRRYLDIEDIAFGQAVAGILHLTNLGPADANAGSPTEKSEKGRGYN